MSSIFEKTYSEKNHKNTHMKRIEDTMGKRLDPVDPLGLEPFYGWTQPGPTELEPTSDDESEVF